MKYRMLTVSTAAIVVATAFGAAHAKSWCANPLWVHEWGVHAFGADGAPAAGTPTPGYFHTSAEATRPGVPVREMPPDSGIRDLPVVHFYSGGMRRDTIPVGVEVGFTFGAASAWFPAADTVRAATVANSPGSALARTELLAKRAARADDRRTWTGEAPALPPDPTRQLVWSRLDLAKRPGGMPAGLIPSWVQTARKIDGALWVNGSNETERFLFYEGRTVERVLLKLERAAGWRADRRAYTLTNTGAHTVHDVFVVHNEGDASYVVTAPAVPPGAHFEVVLEDHPVKDRDAATVTVLRERLVDPKSPSPPKGYDWTEGECVMGRDPAVPVERAAGYHLYRAEADLLLEVWKARFFAAPGTTIVYREDVAYLDQAMPMSLYTDMFNFVVLHRAGLAVWEHVVLP